jgi:recombination protein RecA
MVARTQPKQSGGGLYYPSMSTKRFISTGCTGLDCILGGGWCLGRVANIVGDKSVGKTLLAIEAAANFAKQYPKGHIWYREAEAAFDIPYATDLGLPSDRVDFGPDGPDSLWQTVEDIWEDMRACIKQSEGSGEPGLYIVDSLDAVGSRDSRGRDLNKATYNMSKQRLLSEMFQEIAGDLKRTDIAMLIISQVRDKIGFVVGEKHIRAGGKALDFYTSHVLWLAHLGKIEVQRGGVKRAIGVRIKANCKKNKITVPFGVFEFGIRFGYGVDDLVANLDWLEEVKMLKLVGLKGVKIAEKKTDVDQYIEDCDKLDDVAYREVSEKVRNVVIAAWAEVEGRFKPTRKKYG